jgi:hypothetical protein
VKLLLKSTVVITERLLDKSAFLSLRIVTLPRPRACALRWMLKLEDNWAKGRYTIRLQLQSFTARFLIVSDVDMLLLDRLRTVKLPGRDGPCSTVKLQGNVVVDFFLIVKRPGRFVEFVFLTVKLRCPMFLLPSFRMVTDPERALLVSFLTVNLECRLVLPGSMTLRLESKFTLALNLKLKLERKLTFAFVRYPIWRLLLKSSDPRLRTVNLHL